MLNIALFCDKCKSFEQNEVKIVVVDEGDALIRSKNRELLSKDASEMTVLYNRGYHFIASYQENAVIYVDTSSRFLQLYYLLPLNYITDGHTFIESPSKPQIPFTLTECPK